MNSATSGNLINHWSMNWGQFKGPVSYMCLVGTVIAPWSPTQEVAGSNLFTIMTNIFIQWIHGKTEFFTKTLCKYFWNWTGVVPCAPKSANPCEFHDIAFAVNLFPLLLCSVLWVYFCKWHSKQSPVRFIKTVPVQTPCIVFDKCVKSFPCHAFVLWSIRSCTIYIFNV